MSVPDSVPDEDRLLVRWPELQRMLGLSRVSIWRFERAQKFPRRVRLGARAVAWRRDEVQRWIDDRERGCGRPPAAFHSARANRDRG
jgi:prophage regulatory protein